MTEKERRLKLQKEALRQIKRLQEVYPQHGIVQQELIGVSKSTLNALERKGILNVVKGVLGEEGPDYYYWTEKELE